MRMGHIGDGGVMNELRALREQMTELLDMTTRYDMSFDAALQRMESRMAHVENRVIGIEQGSSVRVS